MEEKRFWNEKRYYSLDYYLKSTFGEKVYKVSLQGGMTCPNRDGKLDTRGCIFCSAGGSGDFAAPVCESVTKQVDLAIAGVKQAKRVGDKFIAYFQSYTNTYAEVAYLRKIFTEAISHPSIVALSIATRPDCLGEDVLQLLWELNQIKPVWVELGLQTIHERTAAFIRRGYPLSVFEQAVKQLTQIDVQVIVHTILGLPFESKNDMIDTIQYLAQFSASRQQEKKEKAVIQGIKLQLLHVLAGTDLAKYRSYFKTLTLEQYVNLVLECIEQLPQDIVIHRTTGDGPKKILLAPEWSASKKTVMNTIHREMKLQDSWQGKKVVIK
ncbi:tIGR01212 family radical SAM protein [Clostridium sp. CAG:411]|jgi:radical SAM protein (TIGR01212 family)|nr:TIGR01212 family radical SAM protein [Lachnospiraceae bacterium]CDE44516.1 tIGR01212 family radical SAM protein [Clostridium sp. CAG:411]